MKALLQRVAPSANMELSLGWVAVSHRWIKEKKLRREEYGKIVKIKSEHGTIYRNLRFSPILKGTPRTNEGQILIDWNGWFNLSGIELEKESVEIEITIANWLEIFFSSTKHPDPAYRHSMAVARIGLYIGIISLILAFK